MKRSIKHDLRKGITFYLKEKDDERTAGIYMQVTFACQRPNFYTRCRCDRNDWNKRKMRVSSGDNKDNINEVLNDYENIVIDLFKEYEHYPTVEKFKKDIQERISMPEKPQSIYILYDEYIEESKRKNSWSIGTVKHARVLKNHLYKFSSDLAFHEITEAKLLSFVEYLQNIPLVNTTVRANVKKLTQFLNWATKKGYNKNEAYKKLELKLKGVSGKTNEPIALSWEELMTVYNLNIPETKNYLIQVRDVFVFLCFTGLRHGEAYNLRRYNIKEDHIKIVASKTDKERSIDLNKYSRAILDKYKYDIFRDDKVLPVISNQKMNEYLKELGEMAGFTQKEAIVRYTGSETITTVLPKSEMLSTHCGRRTFVSIGSLLKIPYEIMAKWTGHSSEAMMSIYRKTDKEMSRLEMEKINLQ